MEDPWQGAPPLEGAGLEQDLVLNPPLQVLLHPDQALQPPSTTGVSTEEAFENEEILQKILITTIKLGATARQNGFI